MRRSTGNQTDTATTTTRTCRIQQDGPNSHIQPDDEQWNAGLRNLGVENKILLYTQPPNSPDLNINDLGFFRALDAAYRKFSPRTAEEIISYVQRAYREYPRENIDKIWLSLMACMNEIIDHHGDNDYKVPHLGKDDMLRRSGQLPTTLKVTNTALDYIRQE